MESLKVDFRSPQRQSRVAIGIILIKFIKGTIKGFWPILLSLFIGRKAGSTFQDVIGYVVLGFAAFNLIGSVLTYFRFYFHLENNSIVIDKGILRRTKTNIPFERIQTINFTQNILHQLFNVVGVEIDTAGAGKAEISIDALNKEDANALREYILAEKEQLTANNAPASDLVEPAEKEAPQLLLQLKPIDLLKVGISQNHLRSMGIIFVFVFSTINEITDNISDIVADQFTQYEGYLINNTLFVFLTSAILVIIIAFLFSLISTLLQYFDLKLWISKKGLKLVRGLLNREEISINTHKVQLVSWSTNPIRRLFKIYTLQIAQASSSEVNVQKSKINVPGSYKHQIAQVIKMVFPTEYSGNEQKHALSKLVKQRIILFLGVIPSLLGLSTWYWSGIECLYFLIALPFSMTIAYLYYKKNSYEINDELIRSNSGIVGTEHLLTQIHKVQVVKISQSIYQRRKKLASLKLYTAAGEMSIPFITISEALAIENFVLYRVETDKREWM